MPLTQAEYEEFLTRVGLVMGLDKTPVTRQQWKVFTDDLCQLLETRSPDEITDEMIKGAWDVTTHIHPVDGSFRY